MTKKSGIKQRSHNYMPEGGQAKTSDVNSVMNDFLTGQAPKAKKDIAEQQKVLAWRVEFESGDVELWRAEDIVGTPAFGRWVTPLIAGGETLDQCPDDESE